MYIRYNNSPSQNQGASCPPPPNRTTTPPPKKPSCPPPENKCKDKEGFKNPLKFLPKEIYNPHTHKFFGKLSGEDILIIGLILMVLDSDCGEDLFLVIALLYVLLSDWIDFGNIFS
ncbi:MAG: hypothetical protein IKC07_03860 [Clostridia bacterium]|nr:hypothetical protein [Clostridia bacterium]